MGGDTIGKIGRFSNLLELLPLVQLNNFPFGAFLLFVLLQLNPVAEKTGHFNMLK